MRKGKVYLVPNLLGSENHNNVIPEEVRLIACSMRHFIVEDLKTARRYLRKLDRQFPIDESEFYILNKKTDRSKMNAYLKPILEGHNMAVISEAGCPGVADPGAEIVALAHLKDIEVAPLVGPSSILLTIMGSGFSGQEFSFHGYLPKDRKDRINQLKKFEADSRRTGYTNIFMDTPFRNMNVLDDLLNELAENTELCIASNLTCQDERIKTMTVKEWREKAYDLSKKPTMFAIGVRQ